MAEAFIVDALRSPTGKRNGSLAAVHGADLGAHVIKAMVERNDIPASEYDDVIFGCVDTIGSLAGDIARTAWLAAGMPMCVPGTTIDRQCGSSQQAVHFAAQAVMSGTQDVILAGGVQTMSAIPIGSAMLAGQPLGFTTPFAQSVGWQARFGDAPVNQFYAAQRIADHWGLSREDMEVFAKESHDRALRAMAEGRFDREIVPFGDFRMDETARASTLEKLATLKPVDPTYPKITPAVSSSTCDAAAAVPRPDKSMACAMQPCAAAEVYATSGAPCKPSWRAAAPSACVRATSTPIRLAIEVPVTKTPLAVSGKPNSSAIQRAIWRSTSTGIWLRPPTFAFRPAASISASMPTGVPPPCTQPMKPGCTLPTA